MSGISLADLGLTATDEDAPRVLSQRFQEEHPSDAWVTLDEHSGRGWLLGLDGYVPDGDDVEKQVLEALREAISTLWPLDVPPHVALAAGPSDGTVESTIRWITQRVRVEPMTARILRMGAAAAISSACRPVLTR